MRLTLVDVQGHVFESYLLQQGLSSSAMAHSEEGMEDEGIVSWLNPMPKPKPNRTIRRRRQLAGALRKF